MVQTMEENKAFYAKMEIERAKKALLHTLGYPIIQDHKANCPVTTSDVDLAEKIYGQDIASIKGKTTRKKPSSAVQNMVDIPQS
jgi:hypothetical protein